MGNELPFALYAIVWSYKSGGENDPLVGLYISYSFRLIWIGRVPLSVPLLNHNSVPPSLSSLGNPGATGSMVVVEYAVKKIFPPLTLVKFPGKESVENSGVLVANSAVSIVKVSSKVLHRLDRLILIYRCGARLE